MKILNVRLKNLNSLYGEWSIDFTAPEYLEDGIFALTGPTGAGKSTLLDAICLALYARTPRLDKITKSTNEIMSRQTGECFAEVVFSSPAGTYRCFWGQRCARGKVDGALQEAKHEISDAKTGDILEDKKSRVKEIIEDKTGMDFDRFTRSVLLAQGSFDSFLKAGDEEKSKILEQITGSAIYSELSIKAFERERDEKNKLELLKAEITGITLLSEDEEKTLSETLLLNRQARDIQQQTCTDLQKAVTWRETIATLEAEITDLAEQHTALKTEQQAFAPDKARLELAERAAGAEALYATLTASRAVQVKDSQALEKAELSLPDLQARLSTAASALTAADNAHTHTKKELKDLQPILRNVRSLDTRLAEKAIALSKQREDISIAETDLKADNAKLASAKEKQQRAQHALKQHQLYLDEHSQDKELVEQYHAIEANIKDLRRTTEVAVTCLAAMNDAEIKRDEAEKIRLSAKMESGNAKEKTSAQEKLISEQQDKLAILLNGRLLREYRNDKEHALQEQALLQKIASLEEHRAQLEDGKDCPLCGAKEHPYAKGNVPAQDAKDTDIAALNTLIKQAEKMEETLETEQKNLHLCQDGQTECDRAFSEAENSYKNAQENYIRITSEHSEAAAEQEKMQHALLKASAPFGIDEAALTDTDTLTVMLNTRVEQWRHAATESIEAERTVEKLSAEYQNILSRIEVKQTHFATLSATLKTLEDEQKQQAKERTTLFADKNPDEEETRVEEHVHTIEIALNNAKEAHNTAKDALSGANNEKNRLNDALKDHDKDIADHFSAFIAKLKLVNISDEAAFLAAILDEETWQNLKDTDKRLSEQHTELMSQQKDRTVRLGLEQEKNLSNEPLEILQSRKEEADEALENLKTSITLAEQKLSDNSNAKQRISDKQTGIAEQESIHVRWRKLYDLIGSSDGRKYRKFAQGITFEYMIAHANHQLMRLSDRYLLERDPAADKPLTLNVIDNYRAGERRPTENLSGGETFIVSLALALGLAHMTSANVRVDSLFLDEGFGTLDENTLDTALDALSHIRQDGKLVGVISHIPAVKERISVHIDITPQSNGKSVIHGAGCSSG